MLPIYLMYEKYTYEKGGGEEEERGGRRRGGLVGISTSNASEPSTTNTRTGANKNRPKIALITHFVFGNQGNDRSWLKMRNQQYLNTTYPNRVCYTERHGYENIFSVRPVDPEHRLFDRVYLLKKHLPNYEWILLTDADYYIVDLDHPIEKFIEEWEKQGVDIQIFIPGESTCNTQDPMLHFPDFASFAMLFKNTPLVREMVDFWYSSRWVCPQIAGVHEQMRLISTLATAFRRYHGLPQNPDTDCLSICPKLEADVAKQHRAFLSCLRAVLDTKNVKRGHTGSSLVPPIAFSEYPCANEPATTDCGLGCQMHRPSQVNMLETDKVQKSFAWHIKPYPTWSTIDTQYNLTKRMHSSGCKAYNKAPDPVLLRAVTQDWDLKDDDDVYVRSTHSKTTPASYTYTPSAST
jgi:hypothetical protein